MGIIMTIKSLYQKGYKIITIRRLSLVVNTA